MLEKFRHELLKNKQVYLRVKAHPGSSETRFKEIVLTPEGETLRINVAAAPEKGKANEALAKYLAKEFGVSKSGVKILSGAGSQLKLIKINL